MSDGALAHRLESLGYIDLFHRQDEEALDEIFSQPDADGRLQAVAVDPEAGDLARFLAAEVLFRRVQDYPPVSSIPALGTVYARALAGGFTVMANPWGLPGWLDEAVAQHVLRLGTEVSGEFRKLLDDDRPVSYWGSKEATLGNSYRYRVKDIAATLVASLEGRKFEPHRDPAVRDREIARLKSGRGPRRS